MFKMTTTQQVICFILWFIFMMFVINEPYQPTLTKEQKRMNDFAQVVKEMKEADPIHPF